MASNPSPRRSFVPVGIFLLVAVALLALLLFWRGSRRHSPTAQTPPTATATPAPVDPPSAPAGTSPTPAPAPVAAADARAASVSAPDGLMPRRDKVSEFDRRSAGTAQPNVRQQAALDQLRQRASGVNVQFDPITGAPSSIMATGRLLSGPLAGESAPLQAVRNFLAVNAALFGHAPEAINQSRVTRNDVTAHNGMTTVVWQQELDGVPLYNTILRANVTKRGELVSIGSHFMAKPDAASGLPQPARTALINQPPVNVTRAISLAAADLGSDVPAENTRAASGPAGVERRQRFEAPGLSDTSAGLAWLPMSADSLRLTWDVTLMSLNLQHMYRVVVDAQTGEVLLRKLLTNDVSNASYRVYADATTKKPFDSPAPMLPGTPTPSGAQATEVPRNLVTLQSVNPTASPNGWLDDGVTQTLGNNVDAHTDTDANNLPDLPRPTSATRVFDFTLDLAQAPSTYRDASATHLFYINNWVHDELYSLGFTESAGNFQTNNFGRGGLGNDAVQADAQDGSGTNNANMSTPPDGSPPRMQMYVFTGPTPDRDGDFDDVIVIHEYVHGLSNRLVGGGVGIGAQATAGMGEGWSDFYGLALLADPASDPNAVYPGGSYATLQFVSGMTTNYYYGIRRYPYSTDLTKNPLTLRDIDPTQASPHTGIPLSPLFGSSNSNPSEVHNVGEVWCMALWECRAALITKYGAVGNQKILQLVTDGMKLCPVDPNLLQSRDAIIQADLISTGGADTKTLWAAFAKRGMGVSAFAPDSSTTTGVTEAFDLPDDLFVSPVQPFLASAVRLTGPITPPSNPYTLTNIGIAPLTWTATKTQPWLDLSALGGSLAVGANATVVATLNSNVLALPAGTYTDTITFTNLTNSAVITRAVTLTVTPYLTRAIYFPLDTDPLWTRSGEWQFGTPTGVALPFSNPDPTSGATGVNVFGINLAGGYASNSASTPDYITAGPLNLTGITGASVRFRRWLNASAQPFAFETVDVSADGATWTNVWNNGATIILEDFWNTVTYPLGSQADNQPAVYIRWGHRASAATSRGGWNIDDVEVMASSTTTTLTANAAVATTAYVTPVPVTLSGTDTLNPGGPLTFAIVANPARGSLSGTAPNLTYTPNAGFFGVDNFSFTVSNGTLTSAPASATITVQPGTTDISIEQPEGAGLTDGGSTVGFGNVLVGSLATKRFVIRNVGAGPLTLGSASIDGLHANQFSVGAISRTALAIGETASFDVTFTPQYANAKTAAIHVLSNDPDETPFDIALTGTGATLGGTVALTRDIARIQAGLSSGTPVVIGSVAFFSGNSVNEGSEIWRTDGTAAGTFVVRDIIAGPNGSGPGNLVNFNGTLFFTANNGTQGNELWKSDGTSAGTVLVRDIFSGTTGSSPANLTVVGATLFFTANESVNGTELWKSDGTTAGTVLVANIAAGATSSSPANLRNVNGTLFFTANDAVNGTELWKSDGTAAGTVLVKDIIAGATSSSPTNLNALGSLLVFTVNDSVNGLEIWKSDGTTGGTTLLLDINPGSASSSPANFASVGGALYFAANTATAGTELWKTDGTAAGTTLVKDIFAGTASSTPQNLTAAAGTLYFNAFDSTNGRELWKSDGTAAGTVLVRDIAGGTSNASPAQITAVGGSVFFSANGDGVANVELWKTDGTTGGTVLVKDINPGAAGAALSGAVNLGGLLIFSANDGLSGQELWKSDGTEPATLRVTDAQTGSNAANIQNLRALNGVVYFSANDGVAGQELWKSDGTLAGTAMVKDITVGGNSSNPANLTNIGNTLYFSAADSANGTELWKSDGTLVGTALVANIASGNTSSSPTLLTPVGSTLFFSATDVSTTGAELWKSNGTAAGTVLVKDINPTASTGSSLANLTDFNGTLIFSANDGVNGQELWKSDGTAAGTVLLLDINPGISGSSPANLRVIGSTLYFTATTAANGTELWKTDGTAAGTGLVVELVGGTGSPSLGNLTVVGSTLFFTATLPASGNELWKTDGTDTGTVLVSDIVAGTGGSSPAALANVGGTLYFRANTPTDGFELWKSDGTGAGTVQVSNINPGTPSSTPSAITDLNGVAYLNATTAANGAELWKSNGTDPGTALVLDLMPGTFSANPTNLTVAGNLLFFVARGPELGSSELFVVNNAPPPEIVVEQPALVSLTDGAASVAIGSAGLGGNPVAKTFTVRNTGTGQPLTLTGITIDGADAASFTASPTNGVVIAAGGATTFTVTLNPTSAGAKTAALHLGNTDSDENPFDVALTGSVVASPQIAVEQPAGTDRYAGATVTFGDAVLGAPIVKTFTLRNTGASALNLSGITFVGTDFTAGAPSSTSVGAGGTATVDITFTPSSTGAKFATLQIASDDVDNNPFTLRLIGIGSAPAGLLRLARDINQIGASPNITSAALIGSTIYFAANTPDTGTELWKTDGTAAGTVLVRDIFAGTGSSSPANLLVIGSTLYFSASTSTNGIELWKSDGTNAGTVLVKDIFTGTTSSSPANLTNVAGTLFFAASDSTANGTELWKSDGTTAGTVLVANINATANSSSLPANLTAFGSTLLFTANDGVNGVELWKSDGTTPGTVLVKDIYAGTTSANPANFVVIGSTLFFTATDATTGTELWKSDGTTAGTVQVQDTYSGASSSAPAGLVNVNGTLFYRAFTPTPGTELWKSDGTNAGTVLVKDINPGSGSSTPTGLLAVDNLVYFSATDGVNGVELWKSDGTAAGTVLVADINTGAGSASPTNLTRVGDLIYFSAASVTGGFELWKSDGTAAGTTLVKELNPSGSSSPGVIVNVGGTVIFIADDGANGRELWRTDGTAPGTNLIADLVAGSSSAAPSNLRSVNGALLFSANDSLSGTELWRSNGQNAGTTMVKDIAAGATSSTPGAGVVIGANLYFAAFDSTTGGNELWTSDGTTAGTVRVKDIFPGTTSSTPANLAKVGITLYFAATGTTADGAELWKSDGTDAGTVLVANINPLANTSSSPANLTDVGGTLFFTANDGTNGTELWKSDGTAVGTVLVSDINPGSASSSPANLRVIGNTLYFTATTAAAGTELWTSDGTTAGTVPVVDLFAGAVSSSPANLTVIGSTLYFSAVTSATGTELWKSDGTSAGTVLVKDIAAGAASSSPGNLTNVNGTLYFSANESVNGTELWKSDGTTAGTVLVKDISPGVSSSVPSAFANVYGTLYFSATTPSTGAELWKSDGTSAGTVMVADIRTGALSSSPINLTVADNQLFFSATGLDLGSELWALDLGLPEVTVEQPPGTNLADGVGSRNIGSVLLGGSVSATFTVKNTGTANLTGLSVSKDGTNSGDFSIGSLGAATLAPGASTTFDVTFTPGELGVRTAAIHIASNDPDENPFDVAINGAGLNALEAWRLANFGTAADTGTAADLADFDGDGILNLQEWAFGTNPTSAFGGKIQINPGPLLVHGSPTVLEVPDGLGGISYVAIYGRLKNPGSVGLTYGLEFSTASSAWIPSMVTPTVIAQDSEIEAVTVPFPPGVTSSPEGFFRVRVSTP